MISGELSLLDRRFRACQIKIIANSVLVSSVGIKRAECISIRLSYIVTVVVIIIIIIISFIIIKIISFIINQTIII